MARKVYKIGFEIDSSKGEAAARRISAALAGVDRAGARAAAGWQRAYDQQGAAAEGSARRSTRAHQEAQRKVDVGLFQLKASAVKFADAQVAGAERARRAQDAMVQRGMVGLDQLRLKAIAFGDAQARAAEKAAAAAAKAQAAQRRAFEKTVVPLSSLQASGLNLQDRVAREQAAGRRAFERQVIPVDSLRASGLGLQDRIAAEEAKAHGRRQSAAERNARQLAAIEDRYLRDEYRRRVEYQRKLEEDADAASGRREAAIAHTAGVVTTAALAGLQVIHQTYRQLEEEALAAAAATLELRKSLRIDATLKGAETTDNKALMEALGFRAKTGLGQAEAGEFTRQFLGSVPIAFQKGNIAKGVSEDLMTQAGIMAARHGGDAGTRGELAGLLGQFGKIGSAREGLGQLEAIRIALTEGRGDDTPLTQQLLKAAGSIVREGGTVGSLPEMAALIGVTSLSAGPQEAGTRAEQVVRALRAGLTKQRGGPGTKVPQGKYLKDLGITEKDSLEGALGKIAPDLQKAEASGRELDVYLAERGFKNYEERRALIETYRNYDVLKQRFAAARKAGGAGVGGEVEAANRRFLATPQGRSEVADALKKSAEVTQGVGDERYLAAIAEAEASPEYQAARQSMSGRLSDRFSGYLVGEFNDPEREGAKLRALGIADERLRARARAAGVTPAEEEAARTRAFQKGGGERWEREWFNQMEGLIESKGGSNAADTAPALKELTEALRENSRLVLQQNRAMGAGGAGAGKAPPLLGRP